MQLACEWPSVSNLCKICIQIDHKILLSNFEHLLSFCFLQMAIIPLIPTDMTQRICQIEEQLSEGRQDKKDSHEIDVEQIDTETPASITNITLLTNEFCP